VPQWAARSARPNRSSLPQPSMAMLSSTAPPPGAGAAALSSTAGAAGVRTGLGRAGSGRWSNRPAALSRRKWEQV
jgi:hypothetical protein